MLQLIKAGTLRSTFVLDLFTLHVRADARRVGGFVLRTAVFPIFIQSLPIVLVICAFLFKFFFNQVQIVLEKEIAISSSRVFTSFIMSTPSIHSARFPHGIGSAPGLPGRSPILVLFRPNGV
ncbi:hypothetical protein R1flu_013026 [Riccia fluitans]|uniref:Uncharacterized protein n=1 Tax=Riccia fluitans TaxID=41844 RepID=A0ABD1ZER9_9MARC